MPRQDDGERVLTMPEEYSVPLSKIVRELQLIEYYLPEDAEETEVRIMRVESGESEDDDEYVDIEDEKELDEVFQVFLDIVEQEG